MNAPSRMPLVLAFLIGMFVCAAGLATAMLATVNDPLVTAVAAVAALACAAAGGITWLILRALQQQDLLELPAAQEDPPPERTPPARIQALPEAELPPAYVAAVMKGIAANRAAMRSRELRH